MLRSINLKKENVSVAAFKETNENTISDPID